MMICIRKTFLTKSLLLCVVLFASTQESFVYAIDANQCRREAKEAVAQLRIDSKTSYTKEAIALAVNAAQFVCLKKESRTLQSTHGTESEEITAPRKNVTPSDQDTLFGIPVGSSRRNPGHKRLKRR